MSIKTVASKLVGLCYLCVLKRRSPEEDDRVCLTLVPPFD